MITNVYHQKLLLGKSSKLAGSREGGKYGLVSGMCWPWLCQGKTSVSNVVVFCRSEPSKLLNMKREPCCVLQALPCHEWPYLRCRFSNLERGLEVGVPRGCWEHLSITSRIKRPLSLHALESSALMKDHIILLNFANSTVECLLAPSHETTHLVWVFSELENVSL